MILLENDTIRIEKHESDIPWLKIFTQTKYKEMSEVPFEIQTIIYKLLNIIELEMIKFYKPTKINIASFGNYLPEVHWHIMARFELDSHFPEPMWGIKQRDGDINLPSFELFWQNTLPLITAYEQ
jgi:diadenosine tetraphosphate (Ap4A) HIT family hydrolase